MTYAGAQYNASLEIYFLGIPLVVVLIYTRQEDRLKLLMVSEMQIQKGEQCQTKNFYYLYIVENKD